jgi:hypothetical protein
MYSSMFIQGEITDPEKIDTYYDYHKSVLFLDTNICIDFYKLWCNPANFIKTNELQFNYLSLLAKCIYEKNINFMPALGIDESSRQMRNGGISLSKEERMTVALKSLLATSFNEFIKHCNSDYTEDNIVLKKETDKSKIRYLHNNHMHGQMLLLKYCAMLKLYLLQYYNVEYQRRLFVFTDFLLNDINCLDGGSISACIVTKNNSIRKGLIHCKGSTIHEVLDAIMNASIDLCQIEMIAGTFKDGLFPIFVSSDKKLIQIHETMKVFGFNGKLPIKGLYFDDLFDDEALRERFSIYFHNQIKDRESYKKLFVEEYLWAMVSNQEKEIKNLTTAST